MLPPIGAGNGHTEGVERAAAVGAVLSVERDKTLKGGDPLRKIALETLQSPVRST